MKKIMAFTLAEVLITLMIIGVVAAITIPALMTQINDRALANQRKTVAAKIAEGFNQMRVAGALATTYDDTTAFVNAMKKYFKIQQVCKSGELENCFVASITEDNSEKKLSDLDDTVVGLKLSDGTSMLIRYNKDNGTIDEGETGKVTWSTDENNEPMYAEYNGIIEYLFDVNSNKAPNTKNKDIIGNLNFDGALTLDSCGGSGGCSDGDMGDYCHSSTWQDKNGNTKKQGFNCSDDCGVCAIYLTPYDTDDINTATQVCITCDSSIDIGISRNEITELVWQYCGTCQKLEDMMQ